MERYIDLHTHSTASDGSMKPDELVRYAKVKNLAAIALTDHDTIDGLQDAIKEGQKIGIEVIPGVEISVDFEPEMHILGYFGGEAYKNIADTLAELRRSRDARNLKMLHKLNEMGFNITMEEVEQEAKGEIVARPHFARVLEKKGYVSSMREAFDKYLSSGKPAYFKKEKLTPVQGIQMIREVGGIPVLAHPIYLYKSPKELDELLGELAGSGLGGIEAVYVDNTEEDTGNLLRLAIKHKLLATGGSDFHGSFKNDIDIGVGRGNLKVPYELLEKLKAALKKLQLKS